MTKSIAFFAGMVGSILILGSAFAGSASWLANPPSNDWNTATNWTAGGPPNSPADIATFDFSTVSNLLFSAAVQINGITFNAGAGTSYTIQARALTFFGSGITNNSGLTQNFVFRNNGGIDFANTASAGFNTAFTMGGNAGEGASTYFFGSSNAGNATFAVNGCNSSNGSRGEVAFYDHSSASDATIIVNGSTIPQCPPGVLLFADNSTAGNATLIANGGTDGGAGGAIAFQIFSTGGTARVEVLGSGILDISDHDLEAPGITIGSLEGNGGVYLGRFILTVGNNNLSTSFSGVLRNGFPGGSGSAIGSLTKIGPGTLTLSGANTYTGTTTINAGRLEVDGSIMSATTVKDAGALGGSGTVRGVTVDRGGTVAPGGAQTLHINGNYVQQSGGVLKIEVVGAAPDASGHLEITGSASLDGTLEVRFTNGVLPVSGQVFNLFSVGGALTGSFAQIIFPDLRAGFQFQAGLVNGTYQITASNDGVPATGFLNISTRLRVGTGDDALIGGFIVQGNSSTGTSGLNGTAKRVIVRAIGPSLAVDGSLLPGRLADPTLELRDNAGTLIFSNDNWAQSSQAQEIMQSGLAPAHEHEAAIIATLTPGSYTAVMRGVDSSTGIGVVEVYDLAQEVPAKLANISSRGLVETGDNVMIGGFIAGNQAMHVMVRAIGPSLTEFGIANALADPTLTLHNAQGAILAFNNDWRDTEQIAIEGTGIPPTDPKESAILATLASGNYTAIVRGTNDTTGVGLVEVYHLQ